MGYYADKIECQRNIIDFLMQEVEKRIKTQYKKDIEKQKRVLQRIEKEVKRLDY